MENFNAGEPGYDPVAAGFSLRLFAQLEGCGYLFVIASLPEAGVAIPERGSERCLIQEYS